MQRFTEGDAVRVDIPDKSDPDFDRYHGRNGVIRSVRIDDASDVTGDVRDERQYRVELEDGSMADFRWRDLRPANDAANA